MNKELAIVILEDMIGDCKGNCLTKDKEALEYAIDVLKKEKEKSIHIKEDAPEVPVPEQPQFIPCTAEKICKEDPCLIKRLI